MCQGSLRICWHHTGKQQLFDLQLQRCLVASGLVEMAGSPISRLPTAPPRPPTRPFSRYSNLSESYVQPHSAIHPLTLTDSNKPRFDTTSRPTPLQLEQSIFSPDTPLPASPSASSQSQLYGADLCLSRASSVDPTGNAPLSAVLAAASLDRFPLSALSANTLHRSRQAVEDDEEDGRRRKDEQLRVKRARQSASRRVAEEERKRRDEADRRIQQLPLHVRQLVYQRWEQTATADETTLQTTQSAAVDVKIVVGNVDNPTCPAADTHRTMHVHDLDDTTLPNQTVVTQKPNDTTAMIPHVGSGSNSSRVLMSRDEQRLFQLRVQQLARHKERLELHRVIAARKVETERKQKEKQQRREQQQQAALLLHQQKQQQQQNETTRTTQPAARYRPVVRRPSSVSAAPRGRPAMLSWLYEELQRRLRALGDVSLAPLCECSRGGGGGGVGRGLVHTVGCEWIGRNEAYATRLLERVEELERVKADQVHERDTPHRSERRRDAAMAARNDWTAYNSRNSTRLVA